MKRNRRRVTISPQSQQYESICVPSFFLPADFVFISIAVAIAATTFLHYKQQMYHIIFILHSLLQQLGQPSWHRKKKCVYDVTFVQTHKHTHTIIYGIGIGTHPLQKKAYAKLLNNKIEIECHWIEEWDFTQAHMQACIRQEWSIERTYIYIFVYSSPFGYSSCVPHPFEKKVFA